jgi:hypothetical protein
MKLDTNAERRAATAVGRFSSKSNVPGILAAWARLAPRWSVEEQDRYRG